MCHVSRDNYAVGVYKKVIPVLDESKLEDSDIVGVSRIQVSDQSTAAQYNIVGLCHLFVQFKNSLVHNVSFCYVCIR